MLLSLYYIYHYSNLWYLYEFTDIHFFVMLPTWTLLMNLFVGILSVLMSMKIYKQSISIVKGISITLTLMAIGQIINFIILSIS